MKFPRRVVHTGLLSICLAATLVGCDDGQPKNMSGVVAVYSGDGPTHGVLGVQFEADANGPAQIKALPPGRPLASSSVSAGDVIVAIGDRPTTRPADVLDALRDTKPGDQVQVGVRKPDGQAHVARVELISRIAALELERRSSSAVDRAKR